MMRTMDFPTSWPGLSRPSTSYFLVLFAWRHVDTRIRARGARLAQCATSIVVARKIDLEHRRIRALARIEIVDGNRRVVALWVGHGPLLELHVLGAEHDHQAAGSDNAALLLGHDGDEDVVGVNRNEVRVLRKVDAVGQQEAQ